MLCLKIPFNKTALMNAPPLPLKKLKHEDFNKRSVKKKGEFTSFKQFMNWICSIYGNDIDLKK